MMMRTLRKVKRVVRQFIEREQPIILMYRRVARVAHDPWHIAVSPDRFLEQIEALVQLRQVVPLRWLASELGQGRFPKKVAVVTFDDGYVDLLSEAKPVLERYTCPATAFLVSSVIGDTHSFWWDELSRIVFETPVLPAELEIEIARQTHQWKIGDRLPSAKDAVDGAPVVPREQLNEDLWRLLRPLEPEPRWDLLVRLCAWAGIEAETSSVHRPLTVDEVHRFASPGFIDLGAHSVTHPVLPLLDEPCQRAEIEGSRTACQELIGELIQTFAYPYGEFDDTTAAYAREAGFECACTTIGRAVSPENDLMLLPRFQIDNWQEADFARKLVGAS
jgi:peptidoglycan/xylan/chitin deacetylase (PgdA/CDA1 family)